MFIAGIRQTWIWIPNRQPSSCMSWRVRIPYVGLLILRIRNYAARFMDNWDDVCRQLSGGATDGARGASRRRLQGALGPSAPSGHPWGNCASTSHLDTITEPAPPPLFCWFFSPQKCWEQSWSVGLYRFGVIVGIATVAVFGFSRNAQPPGREKREEWIPLAESSISLEKTKLEPVCSTKGELIIHSWPRNGTLFLCI